MHKRVRLDVKAPPKGRSGFTPIAPLYKTEHTFAQLGRWRRRSRCYEGSTASARAWLEVASVGYLAWRWRSYSRANAAGSSRASTARRSSSATLCPSSGVASAGEMSMRPPSMAPSGAVVWYNARLPFPGTSSRRRPEMVAR